jgi:HAE1 family hydrophobic/amphiphilic exporter-1
MSFTASMVDVSTRRPVTVSMFTLALLVFGFVLLGRLGLTLLPDLSYPSLTIRTEYPGAAPAEIENLITKPIEESIGVVKNLRQIRSVSRAGQSDVILEFNWGTDMGMAGLDVREKLDIVQLPLDVKRPSLLRFNPTLAPIVRLSMSFSADSPLADEQSNKQLLSEAELIELRRLAEDEVKRRLESIEGVAAVKVSGGLEDEVQVLVDQSKLAQLNLTIEQVASRLKAENVNLSGGRLDQGNQQFLVRTINQYQSIDEIAGSIISSHNGKPVYLRDIARVEQKYKEREAITRLNGIEAVEIAIYKEGDANTVSVAQRIDTRLATVKRSIGSRFELQEIYNQADFIEQAIDEVIGNAILGGLLAMLVLYLFLKNFRSTLIISFAIPTSVIISFNMMYAFDITLNIMSLGGLALAVGLLVDNAIVVLENIARKKEQGLDNVTSAREGAKEVAGAIVAATLTTIAVFLPLVFVEGIAGQLFSDQALTVTFALVVSLLVALTFIPMVSAVSSTETGNVASGTVTQTQALSDKKIIAQPAVIKPVFDTRQSWLKNALMLPFRLLFYRIPALVIAIFQSLWQVISAVSSRLILILVIPFNYGYRRLELGYQRLLKWALAHQLSIIIIAAAIFASSLVLVKRIGIELIPSLSQGELLVQIETPSGTPLEKTDQIIRQAQSLIASLPDIERTYSVSGNGNRLDSSPEKGGENRGELNVVISKPVSFEKEQQVISDIRKVLTRLPEVNVVIEKPALFTFKTPLEVEIVGFNLDKLKQQNQRLLQLMKGSDRFSDIKSSIQQGHPEVQITFDHQKAAFLGLSVPEIAQRVVTQLRGDVATKYAFRDRKIDVLVRVREEDRSSIEDIRHLIVNPDADRPVTLDAIANIEVVVGPSEINRISQERVAIISANLNYGDLGEGAAELKRLIDQLPPIKGVEVRVGGQNEEMEVSFNSLKLALALAIFLVYLVMASQFESLLHPFVILFSIPLALTGAIYALFITQTSISVVVFIGLIMLAGIVVNNAIVLIDKINQLRSEGLDKLSAVYQAGQTRLRPIIMTTLTTVLGMFPLALGLGEGAEIRAPMAITVIGGLLVSTLLTLVVIPVLYSLMDRRA